MSTKGTEQLASTLKDVMERYVKSSSQNLIIFTSDNKSVSYGRKLPDNLDIAGLRGYKTISPVYHRRDEAHAVDTKSGWVAVFVPLLSSTGLEGILLLGDKSNGGIYTPQDITFLNLASVNIGQTVQGARAFQEIADFNKTLRTKIREATRELRTKNHELESLHKTKDDFISMASHQLRPKLTASAGFLDLLDVTKLKTTREQAELIGLTREGIRRMTDIVVDMLDISRMDAHELVLDFGDSTTDVANLVAQEVSAASSSIKTSSFVFAPEPDGLKAKVMVDEKMLREAISNLLSNAYQYSPKGSVIRVEVRKTGRFIEVLVIDKGIGMTKEEMSNLFTKFYRSNEAKQIRPNGSGIGLYMNRKIIEAHAGETVVQSEKGKGSTIGFRIPLKHTRSHG